jgi:hypothetical protein
MNQPLTHYSQCEFYKEVDDQDLCLDPGAPACAHPGQCCWECPELCDCDSACPDAAGHQASQYSEDFHSRSCG